ncbi:S-4TM family putative pore-forming effector [Hippea jasoniae]|uniref:S-4TM family putative pore-forming effector n=1 Tax=Hippea jasoniae TaxID=944479 RepID=UPI0006897693|nr:S-4TM family putative pore-forming effector [Hippea jasoniae]
MSDNINYAFPEQNNEEFIKLLKAQRYYYKVAKRWQMGRFLISILIPILFVIAKLKLLNEFEYYRDSFAWVKLPWVVSISLLWVALSFVFKYFEKRYISIGAAIQEEFDTKLFGIEKNKICFFKEPTPEEISNGEKKFKGNTESLNNWYPVSNSGNKFGNILLAQRTNLIWTENLKNRYKYLFLLLIGSIIRYCIKTFAILLNLQKKRIDFSVS